MAKSIEPNIADLANGWFGFLQDKLKDVVFYTENKRSKR